MQMYNYDGQAISAVYSYLYWETDSMQEEASAVFTAQDLQGVPVVLNHHGEEIYRGLAGQWLNPLTAERIIVSDDNKTEHRATLQTLEGEVLHEKQYDGIYPVYLTAKQYPYSQKSSLVIGNYRFGETTLVDLLDADGNLLFERAKSIQALAEDRFWVEKGFSQGLMDREGNWLYQQSLFDSAVDE